MGGCLPGAGRDVFETGEWQLCDRSGWPDNQSCLAILAWCWTGDGQRSLIVVNYWPQAAQARVHLPWADLKGRQWRLSDALSSESLDRSGDEMGDAGLYVDLGPWQCHVFEVT